MWYLWIAYLFGALFLIHDDYDQWKKTEGSYDYFKEHWKKTHCSQGKHFVGVKPPYPHCEMCGKVPTKIFHAPSGEVEGWEW